MEQRKNIITAQKQCSVRGYRIKSAIFVAFASYIKWLDEAKAADQKVEFIIDQNSDSSWWLENICVRKANAAGDEQFAV